MRTFPIALALATLAPGCTAFAGLLRAEMSAEAAAAFDRYAASVERSPHPAPSAEVRARLRGGDIEIESRAPKQPRSAMLHDWTGEVFLPGATLAKTVALFQDYAAYKNVYQPEVLDSRLLDRSGDVFHVALRLLKKKVITVVLDSEYEARYAADGPSRMQIHARSTSIREVENYGQSGESALPPGKDHGFLWRLNSYWRLEEADGGVYAACRAVSLTRDIPSGFSWIVAPIVRDLPRQSLRTTLEALRKELKK